MDSSFSFGCVRDLLLEGSETEKEDVPLRCLAVTEPLVSVVQSVQDAKYAIVLVKSE